MRALLCGLLAVSCAPRLADDPSRHSVVVLDPARESVCGGTQVDVDRVLTAHHCVADAGELVGGVKVVRIERRSSYWGLLVADEEALVVGEELVLFGPPGDQEPDGIAVLRTQPQADWARVAWRPALATSRVHLWHHGLGFLWSYDETFIEALPSFGGLALLRLDAEVGMSGSGVFDEHERLVGVVLRGNESLDGVVMHDARAIGIAMRK